VILGVEPIPLKICNFSLDTLLAMCDDSVMANVKYFATCSDQQVELTNPAYSFYGREMDRFVREGQTRFVSELTKGNSTDKMNANRLYAVGFCSCCGLRHAAERRIVRPAVASNHKCGGRCLNAKGGDCECACGGANHGKGGCS
jgi:hypothetical protein